MGYLPISLEVAGRRCIVVGGGAVAERKVCTLLEAEAAVTIVSPTLTERLQFWSREGKISQLPTTCCCAACALDHAALG